MYIGQRWHVSSEEEEVEEEVEENEEMEDNNEEVESEEEEEVQVSSRGRTRKPVKTYFDEFENPEILPANSRRKKANKNKTKKQRPNVFEEPARRSGRTTTRKTYIENSSSDEEMEEDDEIFEKLPSRSTRTRNR